ncbi:MAG TPA: glycosyltransferase family 87 protein [Tepidisphaeraceae bacterium]|nr:glycosyltransferase family 87 protein [Tepidisphaeraceae bacterium]
MTASTITTLPEQSTKNTSGRSPLRRVIPCIVIFIYASFLWNYGVQFRQLTQLDLGSFYWGAELTFHEHHSPYDLAAMDRLSAGTGQKVFPYLYPPPSLLLMSPLALVSYRTAILAMLLANHFCFLLIAGVLFCRILKIPAKSLFGEFLPATLLLYLISSHGIALTIDYGQVNLIVLAMLCLAWWRMKQRAPAWQIALPLALAIILKTYPAIFVVLLLLRREYRAIAWLCAMFIVAGALSCIVLPHGLWHDWLTSIAPTGGLCRIPLGLHSPAAVPNQGINGFVSRLCFPTDSGPPLLHSRGLCVAIGYVLSLGVLGSTIFVCRGPIPRDGDPIDLQFSAFLIASFLIAPLAWEHHLAFVAPAVIVALYAVLGGPGRINRLALALLAIAAVVIAYPMPLESLPLSHVPMLAVNSGKMYAVFLVWGVIIWQMRRTGLYWRHGESNSLGLPALGLGDSRLCSAGRLLDQPLPCR